MESRRRRTLVVVNPGHFHAALTLRRRHPLLSDEVYVYAEDGPELDDFLQLVGSFNHRLDNPTSWGLHVYRGPDYIDALLQNPPGDVAIVAGKNHTKLATMRRLHAAGMHVLGDKTWLVDQSQLKPLAEVTASPPLAMDIMTERFEIATRLQQALSVEDSVFGGFRSVDDEPAVYFRSVHHLYKEVNGEPLVRPLWYFDTAIQGEGITDVTTHLVDLAQWMVCGHRGVDYARDVVLTGAQQWPTAVSRDMFERITGSAGFPPELLKHVADGDLQYLCNTKISFRLCNVSVQVDSIWDPAIPEGGGDTHYGILRGETADLIVDQGPETGFEPRLRAMPTKRGVKVGDALQVLVPQLRSICPGLAVMDITGGYELAIPAKMHQGHEARFAEVLNEFLGYVDAGTWPQRISQELRAKYTLLAEAYVLSHR